jgi:hypothetical protein
MSSSDFLARKIGFESYSQYLKSEHWHIFSEGMKSAQPHCWCCGNSKNLHVHHINYKRIGQEWPTDVVVACARCHLLIHSIEERNAHIIIKNKFSNKNKNHKHKRNNWVSNWRKLVNKSKHQTITELQLFLQSKNLLEGVVATNKAYKLGFTKSKDNKTLWNLKKYISMMKADRKIKKLEKKEKIIHPALKQMALVNVSLQS